MLDKKIIIEGLSFDCDKMDKDFSALIGYYVETIELDEDRQLIRFKSRDSELIFSTFGDCCAYLEFEDIEYPAKKPEHGWRIDSVDEDKEYGYRLKSYEGDIVISCRRLGGDWPGYETGVILVYYKRNVWFDKEHKWTKFKEIE